MKILLNLLAAKQGGQVTRAIEFISRFKSMSDKDDLLIILTSNYFPIKIKNSNSIRVIKINFLIKYFNWFERMLWENLKLIYLVKNLKPDIYLTFSHSLPFFNLNIPTVVGFSNLAPFSHSAFISDTILGKIRLFLLKSMIISSAKKASAVIALSNQGKKVLVQYGILNKKIKKISIGVKKQKKISSSKILNSKEKYILYVSHFYRYKNFENLILAYSKLSNDIVSEFRLKLVGNFSDKGYVKNLKKMSKKINIEHKIDFIKGVKSKKLHHIYKNASIFIFPSKIENCPNILLEAMSYGLPVLTTKTPPMPEFSGKSAKFFDINDPIDLSKKITELLKSKKLLIKMSNLSYIRSNMYSWDSFTINLINFCKIISNKDVI